MDISTRKTPIWGRLSAVSGKWRERNMAAAKKPRFKSAVKLIAEMAASKACAMSKLPA